MVIDYLEGFVMSCKVSVIIPVYNVEKFLPQCVESVINQTLKDIEIICIDDGSKDKSSEILNRYRKADKRISVISKSNGGYGAACNYGLKIANGEYVCIVEADDFIDKFMLEDLYNIAFVNNADIVKSSYYEYSEKNGTKEIRKIDWSKTHKMPEGVFKLEDYPQFLYFHPSIWSCIYKMDFIRKNNINFVEAKKAGWADNPFQVQTLFLAKKLVYTDNAYYYYRLTNPDSSSTVVNINNPFDRSDEVHNFLVKNNIKDEDLLANLYKRELGYIDIVLSCISNNLFDFACEKIDKMLKRMDKDIIFTNSCITDYEKFFFEICKTKDGIREVMNRIKSNSTHQAVTAVCE